MEENELAKMFGAEVKRRRAELGIPQETLAERANLHRTYISDVEAGKRNPSLASIQRVASALGAPVSAVFCSAEDPAVTPSRDEPRTDRLEHILLAEADLKAAELTLDAFKTVKLANRVQIVRDGAAVFDFILCRGAFARRRNKKFPQVILLNLELPKIAGLEVLRRLKTDEATRTIPVVVLTALRKDGRVPEALRLGAEGPLVKPLDFQSFSRIMPKLSFGWALLKPEVRRFL